MKERGEGEMAARAMCRLIRTEPDSLVPCSVPTQRHFSGEWTEVSVNSFCHLIGG